MRIHKSGSSDDHTYSKEEARAVFHRAVKDGAVVSTKHARERMAENGIDNNDILKLANTGVVLNDPELHIKTNQMTYRIESESQKLKVVFNVLGINRVRLITAITE